MNELGQTQDQSLDLKILLDTILHEGAEHVEDVLGVARRLQGNQSVLGVIPQAHTDTLNQHTLVVWGLCTSQLLHHVADDVLKAAFNALNSFKHLND